MKGRCAIGGRQATTSAQISDVEVVTGAAVVAVVVALALVDVLAVAIGFPRRVLGAVQGRSFAEDRRASGCRGAVAVSICRLVIQGPEQNIHINEYFRKRGSTVSWRLPGAGPPTTDFRWAVLFEDLGSGIIPLCAISLCTSLVPVSKLPSLGRALGPRTLGRASNRPIL
jgi:hypothetical protein